MCLAHMLEGPFISTSVDVDELRRENALSSVAVAPSELISGSRAALVQRPSWGKTLKDATSKCMLTTTPPALLEPLMVFRAVNCTRKHEVHAAEGQEASFFASFFFAPWPVSLMTQHTACHCRNVTALYSSFRFSLCCAAQCSSVQLGGRRLWGKTKVKLGLAVREPPGETWVCRGAPVRYSAAVRASLLPRVNKGG